MTLKTQPMGWLWLGLAGLLGLMSCSGGGGSGDDRDMGSRPPAPLTSQSIIEGEPPEGSPRFLTAPYDDESVSIFEGWYYDRSRVDLGCPHPFDQIPLTRHCAIDYIKGDLNDEGLSWEVFPVIAAAPGRATVFISLSGAGTYAVIEHDEVDPEGRRFYTRYLHLNTATVALPFEESVRVERGEFIGMAGRTGQTTGIHLHFSVLIDDTNGEAEDSFDFAQVDPYDLAGGLLRSGRRPIRDHYQPGSGCGPNHLWIDCPLD